MFLPFSYLIITWFRKEHKRILPNMYFRQYYIPNAKNKFACGVCLWTKDPDPGPGDPKDRIRIRNTAYKYFLRITFE